MALPTGDLSAPSTTFWQLFVLDLRNPGSSRWALVTPPGAADNGGLALAGSPGGQLMVGIRPSQELAFSPLATTADLGRTWTPDALPGALATATDSLAAGPQDLTVALVAGGHTLLSEDAGSRWATLATPASIGPAVGSCHPTRFTAVATGGTDTFLGMQCAQAGVSAIAVASRAAPSRWVALPLSPPNSPGRASVQITRLVWTTSGLAVLMQVSTRGTSAYQVGWWDQARGAWTFSSFLAETAPLAGVAISGNGSVAALAGTPSAANGWLIEPTQTSWARLPQLPAETVALALSGTRVDAFTVATGTVTDFALQAGRGWVARASVAVPQAAVSPH